MQKTADVFALPQWYHRTVGSRPYAEIPLAALLSGGAAYAGGGLLTRKLLEKMPFLAKTPQQRAALIEKFRRDGTLDYMRRVFGLVGAGAGAVLAGSRHFNKKAPGFGLLSKRTEAQWQAEREAQKRRAAGQAYMSQAGLYSGRPGNPYTDYIGAVPRFQKQQSYVDAFEGEHIPVRHSMDLVNQDPFLNLGQKVVTNSLIGGAEEGGSGLTTSGQLVRSAVRAGVGYGVASLFGQGLGKILSLPPDEAKAVSRIGGVAGAVLNSGIMDALGD